MVAIIEIGAHWNTQNTSQYITIHIVMYFAYSNGLPSQYCHHYAEGGSKGLGVEIVELDDMGNTAYWTRQGGVCVCVCVWIHKGEGNK